ncbi:LCP family protein required for cell wall assembly [Clostridium acetobutylicum]|uniref:Transcriptional regulator, LytR family n=1 Tax=Clostridium acetobutylicum (strain ATCC 824 / DSM 792 / JCM 1419 / IAM 19013 / LMG 5710 / NBRC 13948 / NRRL B-527 / VKM B-1787 / 2291 / W) TaxID=272562 RepID=Q97ER2_CLOAB|nr:MULTISPECIES: LCP family protein [Clostridium]AAK80986.1 Transcriptional regulator, LytR family [Clostridium acetobutylicum ATCC 824]ADZ22089.1 Transcriptional regulator, LytR family [Clostridium acetobutylicum EA 2018]AEI33248.1 LytR family transcriptional regulator [Clostridium acetobutylicum DSM 1731]AWV78603.1 LytR family transcriptional regulator [Clostridium acetobutylicum]MBC2393463.1 LCP family protein [Clostridium acetobutylicum]
MKTKDKKKFGFWKKFFIVFFILIFGIGASGTAYFYSKTSKMKKTEISKKPSELGISNKTQDDLSKYSDTVNIALFGVDRRLKTDVSRSDSIMILTMDPAHKKLKLSSIMRDTYVNVDGHGMTKITHAYAYGGPQLAIKTINENFKLNIKDYVTVDFYALEKIIDKLNGVEINVQSDEVGYLNGYIDEVSKYEKVTPNHVTSSGKQLLDGRQAVAYSRIRYTAGGDFVRTERQRTVLMAVFNKLQAQGKSNMVSMFDEILPYTETNMGSIDIAKYGTKFISSDISNIDQERFPLDGYCSGVTVDNVWYLKTDLNVTSDQMRKYIFEDVKPSPKASLVNIPEK